MSFEFMDTNIPEVKVIIPKVFKDKRGFFIESFKKSDFVKNGIPFEFVQDNYSNSSKDVLRGLHYQLNPQSQGKLVRCIKGSLLDVVVDIRKGSPTYGKYVSVKLTGINFKMLWVPPGFAHGFLSLEDNTEMMYKCTEEYSPDYDSNIAWNDFEIGINWGINDPIISEKDKFAPSLKDAKNNFEVEK